MTATGGAKITRGKGTYDLCVTKVHSIEHRGAYAQHDLEHPESDKTGHLLAAPDTRRMERSIIRYATVAEAEEAKKLRGIRARSHRESGLRP